MVYIKSLNKRIFPHYIPPYPDELFSSWFCRLAINHQVKPQSFVQNYWDDRNFPFWNRDIDLSTSKELLKVIERHTPLSLTEVKSMFLTSYESFIAETIRPSDSYLNNILVLGINHRKRKRFGQMYCPGCLRKNGYYKKVWRLQTSILCTACKEYLADRCPYCSSPIAYHRINISNNTSTMNFAPLHICYNCRKDLSACSTSKPSSKEIAYQEFIDDSILLGHNSLTQYSFTYVQVLLMLAQNLRSNGKKGRLREILTKRKRLPKNFTTTSEDLKFWSIEDRTKYLPCIHKLLIEPEQFKEICLEGNIFKSYLAPEKEVPYWFFSCLVY